MKIDFETNTSLSSSAFLLFSSLSAFALALSADLSSMSENYQRMTMYVGNVIITRMTYHLYSSVIIFVKQKWYMLKHIPFVQSIKA